MTTRIEDHLAWLFRPGRFLFREFTPQSMRIPGWETVRFVDQPAEVHAVNQATGDLFLGGAGNAFLGALLGPQSVFLLDHEQHRLARRIIAPTLTRRAMAEKSADVDRIIDVAISQALSRSGINVGAWARRIAMTSVCRIALGVTETERVERLFRRFEATTGYLANVVSYCKPLWVPRGVFSIGGIVATLVRRIDAELYPLIDARRRELLQTGHAPVTALDALLAAQPQHGYDDAFIRDNLVALLAAGYDTSGAAMTWLCYWMSREPGRVSALRRARELGRDKCLEAFRNEVLRYCPPVEILPRRIDSGRRDEAAQLLEGIDRDSAGPDGPMVCPFVHRIHHDPAVHPRPDSFEPARFESDRRYTNDEFLPFGAGPRMCLGVNLGRLLLDRLLVRSLDRRIDYRLRKKLRPVRRNVSIWPAFVVRGQLTTTPEET